MVTSGVMELAYCMPRYSCLPPAPLSPVRGSKTPMTTVSPSAVAVVPLVSPVPLSAAGVPQAHRPAAIQPASRSARIFFFIMLPPFDSPDVSFHCGRMCASGIVLIVYTKPLHFATYFFVFHRWQDIFVSYAFPVPLTFHLNGTAAASVFSDDNLPVYAVFQRSNVGDDSHQFVAFCQAAQGLHGLLQGLFI